jgi:PhnB protein
VPDIKDTFSKAISVGCKEVQPVTEVPDYGVSNAIFSDPLAMYGCCIKFIK